jgi:hypothetical protein
MDLVEWLISLFKSNGPAFGAVGTDLSAFLAIFALIVSSLSFRTSRRALRHAVEPYLEVEPRKLEVRVEWDLTRKIGVEAEGDEPGELRHLWGEAYKAPRWRLVNVGNGPALDITAHWYTDCLLLEVALGLCRHIFNKNLVHQGSTVRDLSGGSNLIRCRWHDQTNVGFRAAGRAGNTEKVSDQEALSIPLTIFGGVVLRTLSFTDQDGEVAHGTLDLRLKYKNRFRRQGHRDIQFEYYGTPFRELTGGKNIVKAVLEIEPRANPETAPLIQRYLGRKIDYWLRAGGLLLSLKWGKLRDRRDIHRSLRKLRKIKQEHTRSS